MPNESEARCSSEYYGVDLCGELSRFTIGFGRRLLNLQPQAGCRIRGQNVLSSVWQATSKSEVQIACRGIVFRPVPFSCLMLCSGSSGDESLINLIRLQIRIPDLAIVLNLFEAASP